MVFVDKPLKPENHFFRFIRNCFPNSAQFSQKQLLLKVIKRIYNMHQLLPLTVHIRRKFIFRGMNDLKKD